MVPVLNIPFLEHVFRNLKSHGVTDVILAQHHLAAPMVEYFGNGAQFGLRLTYVVEDEPRGTAGAIKNAEQHLNGAFFVLNGDIFSNRDFTAMLRLHRERGAVATITLTPVENPTIYGVVETDRSGKIRRFLEKPKPEEVTTNMINAGTYILEPEVLKIIPPGVKCSIERETFPSLLATGKPVYAYSASDYWMDTGTPEKYLQLHRDLLAGKCEGYTFDRNVTAGGTSRVHTGATLDGKIIIGERCEIESGARLTGPLAIGDGCRVERGAALSDSVLWSGVTVRADAEIRGCAIANDCTIGSKARLADAVLGDHISVPAGAILNGDRLFPEGEKP
jgi:mannose-1-phosphate guanylyltransferase